MSESIKQSRVRILVFSSFNVIVIIAQMNSAMIDTYLDNLAEYIFVDDKLVSLNSRNIFNC